MKIDRIITWNGFFYGRKQTKNSEKYYKSHTCRFDSTMGGTEEISLDEFLSVARKYNEVMFG